MPLIAVLLLPETMLLPGIAVIVLVLLAVLGALAAHTGGAPLYKGILRVTFWGLVAMAVTAGVGRLFGTAAFVMKEPAIDAILAAIAVTAATP